MCEYFNVLDARHSSPLPESYLLLLRETNTTLPDTAIDTNPKKSLFTAMSSYLPPYNDDRSRVCVCAVAVYASVNVC